VALIDFQDVSKRYANGRGEHVAVRQVSLAVRERELMVLLGESGSGKTTLLKLVNRLVEASEGRVSVGGVDVRAQDACTLRRGIGYVIQQVGLFPHLSVADNVAVVPRLCGWPRAQVDARVDELLALVGLLPGEYRTRLPAQLSGGQRQRVGVARALAARPRLLLMDEPFGALDAITREGLQLELRRLHDELGLTTLLVTHDLVEALTLADRIAVVRAGELVQVGTPAELLGAPGDAYVARLMSMARRQAGRVEALLQPEARRS
jgi:osmoprotectant transport system ATP-binding protein